MVMIFAEWQTEREIQTEIHPKFQTLIRQLLRSDPEERPDYVEVDKIMKTLEPEICSLSPFRADFESDMSPVEDYNQSSILIHTAVNE